MEISEETEEATTGTGTPFDDAIEAIDDERAADDFEASDATEEATTGTGTPFDDAIEAIDDEMAADD